MDAPGNIAHYYKSSTAGFSSEFIGGVPIAKISKDERIDGVIEAFSTRIGDEVASCWKRRSLLIWSARTSTMEAAYLTSSPIHRISIRSSSLSVPEQTGLLAGLLLMAASAYLRNACHLVVIECLDVALAFDMFQSLNATGTPLTAFEVFKPTVVRLWAQNYAQGIKGEIDRIEKVIEANTNASEKRMRPIGSLPPLR